MPDAPALNAPLLHNQFPAKLRHPAGQITDRVRVAVTRDWAYVYGEHRGPGGVRQPVTVLTVPVSRVEGYGTEFHFYDTDDGLWVVTKGSGCGCHSPLLRMPPYAERP